MCANRARPLEKGGIEEAGSGPIIGRMGPTREQEPGQIRSSQPMGTHVVVTDPAADSQLGASRRMPEPPQPERAKRSTGMGVRAFAPIGLAVALAVGCTGPGGADESEPSAGGTGGRPADRGSAPHPTVTFGVVADVQYCDCEPKQDRFYRGSIAKLREAMQSFRSRKVDFVIELGDIIDRDFESYATVLPEYRVDGVGKQFFVLGNHEWKIDATDRPRVLRVLGLASRYYCFATEGWRLVVMDGTELSGYATSEGSAARSAADAMFGRLQNAGTMNAMAYNGGITPQQLDWLHVELTSAQAAGDRVIVVSHFPVYPPEASHNLWNDGAVRAALEQYPGVAVAHLSGHYHVGGYWQHGGVHYLTLHGMVETMEDNAFAVLRLYPDRIEVDGYGRQPSYTLHPVGAASRR